MALHHPLMADYLCLASEAQQLLSAVHQFVPDVALAGLQGVQGVLAPKASMSNLEASSEMVLVARLVLECLTGQPGKEPVTAQAAAAGNITLAWIAAQCGLPTAALMSPQECWGMLICSSVAQLHSACCACTTALLHSLSPANCFSLMAVAASCGPTCATHLAAAARQYALSHFHLAMETDVDGFRALSSSQLVSLLSDDALKCTSESDVFVALMAWYQGQPQGADLSGLAGLSARCVRNGLLNLHELEVLDQHAEVSKNEEALKIVAGWYIEVLFGSQPAAHKPRTSQAC